MLNLRKDKVKNVAMTMAAAVPLALATKVIEDGPGWVKTWYGSRMHHKVEFNSDQDCYYQVIAFVTQTIVDASKSRDHYISLAEKYDYKQGVQVGLKTSDLILGFGVHHGTFHGTKVRIARTSDSDGASSSYKESLEIRFTSRLSDPVKVFHDELIVYLISTFSKSNDIAIYRNRDDQWSKQKKIHPRSAESLFLNDNQFEKALKHIQDFDLRRDWCLERGIPHHTGIMLKGQPGTAKSSLIHVLASVLHRDIYYLDLSTIEKPTDLADLFAGDINWAKVLLVTEDIDATGADVMEREAEGAGSKTVALSSLLNILDGIATPEDLVVIATTNHYERLDSALVRPGRFDLTLELGLIGWSEFVRMAAFFDHDPKDYSLEKFSEMTGAEMRSILLESGVTGIVAHQRSLGN